MEIALSSQNFDKEVLQSPTPVLVDFWAEWCGPCHIIAPSVSQIAQEYEGKLKVGKLNVDLEPGLAQKYQIRSIPNLKIFKSGQVVEDIVGAMPKTAIESFLKKHL